MCHYATSVVLRTSRNDISPGSNFGGIKWSGLLIAMSLLLLLRAKKAILLLLFIVLTIEDSRVVVR